jgi:hypothetical protein
VGALLNSKKEKSKQQTEIMPEARKPGLFYFQFVRIGLFLYICTAQI